MNKDVIYIEPDDDITDILANIKDAKNKIIALVPPKKTGVLQSVVNFKLIAKTATQYKKTIVLITADEALLALANKVKMPTAKTLQSKPKLPDDESATEFGDEEDEEGEVIDGDKSDQKDEPEEAAEEDSKKSVEVTKKEPAASAKKTKAADIELDGEEDADDKKDEKASRSKKNIKIPNFKKYRKFIILAVILLIAIISFGCWATKIAPRARISVKVKATTSNFSQTVSFVTDETKSDPEKGIFYIEQKTTTKKASSDFEATGEVDKGERASGTIVVTRLSGDTVTEGNMNFSIPANTVVTISGKQFIVTDGGSVNVKESDLKNCGGTIFSPKYCLSKNVSSGKISVVAKEVGDDYNMAAATSGITLNINTTKKYSVTSSAMTGGSSKIVKIVSQDDIDKANNDLSIDTDKEEAREELLSQFGSEYILISDSFVVENSTTTTSPALNEEVGEGVTPKIIRETKYVAYAVKSSEVDTFISVAAKEKIKGDDTQTLYSTGVAKQDDEDNKAFFESFKNNDGNMVAKLKSVIKTGPRLTEEMIKEESLGEKIGKVQSKLRSYKGVTEASVKTSYFWVTSVPNDDNKVEIEITIE